MRPNHALLVWHFLLVLCNYGDAVLVNKTIDDKFGDTTTGRVISYSPAAAWNDGTNCKKCTARPDKHEFFKRTWMDSSFRNDVPNSTVLTASVTFNGTAVYVLCALAHTITGPVGDSDMYFFIDNRLAGSFTREAPGTTGYDYNVTVFAVANLPPMEHNITIQNGYVGGPKSLILLDAIIYTQDDGEPEPEPSSTATATVTSNTGSSSPSSLHVTVIVAVVLGSICAVVLSALAFLLYCRSRAQSAPLVPYPYPSVSQIQAREIQAREEEVPPSYQCQYIRVLYFQATAAARIVAKAEWFPECFARLTNLHKLRLFSCVDGPLPAASLAAFAAPQLRKLYIQGWQFAGVYDLLSMFPPTLEELQLDSIKFDRSPDNVVKRELELKAPRIPGVRLEALRNLEIYDGDESIFATPHLIECPNLARLFICWPGERMHLPPWLPASLPELVLSCGPDGVIPHFGALRPASVTLAMGSNETTPYLNFFTWARDCIDRLPDPRAIRALTIDIDTGYCHSLPEGFYPALSDYEMFSRFLCHLRASERDGGSCLQSITLRIKLSARTLTASDTPDGVEARELAKLEKGFTPLVKDNVLNADLILLIPDQEPEGSALLMHCSIRRRV